MLNYYWKKRKLVIIYCSKYKLSWRNKKKTFLTNNLNYNHLCQQNVFKSSILKKENFLNTLNTLFSLGAKRKLYITIWWIKCQDNNHCHNKPFNLKDIYTYSFTNPCVSYKFLLLFFQNLHTTLVVYERTKLKTITEIKCYFMCLLFDWLLAEGGFSIEYFSHLTFTLLLHVSIFML